MTGPLAAAEARLRTRGITGRRALEQIVAAATAAVDGSPQELLPTPVSAWLPGMAWEGLLPDVFRAREGQFFTPPPMADSLISHLGDLAGCTVLDPMCGAGSLLVAAARAGARVIGVERDPDLVVLARLAARAAGVDARIEVGDGFDWRGKVDVVVANPPFSQRRTGPSRFLRAGSVPSELLLLERLDEWLGSGGRAALVLPWSVAGTARAAAVRRFVATQTPVSRILRLPEGAFRPFGGAGGRVALVWMHRGRAGPVSFGDVLDPGWDVRLRRVVRTAGTLAPVVWTPLPPGHWEPTTPSSAERLGDVATVRRERISAGEPAQRLDLGDVVEGRLRPVDGPMVRRGRWRLRPGDVVLQRLRARDGEVAYVDRDGLAGSPEWISLRFADTPRWALHALRTPTFRSGLPCGSGQTHPRIDDASVCEAPIPWASEPKRRAVDRRSTYLHAMRDGADQALDALQRAVDAWAAGDGDALAAVLGEKDAAEVVGDAPGACLMTCEHASCDLPSPWVWPTEDAWVRNTHWAWDPGAADVARAVRSQIGGRLVLARFSRLLCDPNRGPWEDSWIRRVAEGRPIRLNAAVDGTECARRHDGVWSLYHAAVEAEATRHPGRPVVSFHSFTAVYDGGPRRPMALGVLFDRAEDEAKRLAAVLARSGLPVALNEPWSGRAGLMYAPERAARATGGPCIEIEVRNDVATDPALRPRVVDAVVEGLRVLGWA